MARKIEQIMARGVRRWGTRVYLGRDTKTRKRNYNRTVRGSIWEGQHI